MLRGLLAGGLSGLVVGGTALTVLSVVNEAPAGASPPASPQIDAPTEAAPAEIASSTPQSVADDSTGDAVAAPVPQVQIPAVNLTAPIADTTPAAVPKAGDADALPDAPEVSAAPSVDLETVDPVLPNPQSIAPQVPSAEQDVVISTEPAQLPQTLDANEETKSDDSSGSEAGQDALPNPVEVVVAAPTESGGANADDADTPPATDQEPAAPLTDSETPAEDIAVADESGTQQKPATIDATTPETSPTQPEAPAVVSIVPEAKPSLPGGDTGIAVRRPTQPEASPEPAPTPDVDPDAPAIEKFAAAFENPQNKPMISVVLIDDGSLESAVGAVASLNVPVTVVLDPDLPDATAKMADYRAAGIEVAVRTSLPAAATPTDVEQAFEVSFAKLPDTVLLIDDGTAGLQNNRSITEFAMEALAQDGRGFLTISSGLNTALRLAEQNGVPAGVIYRDLDAEGQDARVIRRFLDQAAFRARQDDVVFLLGRVRPDTISALILWGSANRANQVALAPASAALRAGDQ